MSDATMSTRSALPPFAKDGLGTPRIEVGHLLWNEPLHVYDSAGCGFTLQPFLGDATCSVYDSLCFNFSSLEDLL
jgi:hypothetical protein